MVPTQKGTPLRRSEVTSFRTPIQTPVINDDEEERRQARRRTAGVDENTTIEDNETLKSCLKIFHENKLSKENAWSVSLIDTLSTLLGKHHKSIKNFKVAGSTLEASSKVYGLRVDSVHTDVMRMSSGLNKRKYNEEDGNNEDDTNQESQTQNNLEQEPKTKPRRKRKLLSTITKNKETINAVLETHLLPDPIFAKLNTISGSINSSNRLLQNSLPSVDSELQRKMSLPFWDSNSIEDLTYLKEYDYSEEKLIEIKMLASIKTESLVLRPHYTGYVISDTPLEQGQSSDQNHHSSLISSTDFTRSAVDAFDQDNNNSQLAVAFDINADVEPLPPDTQPYVDVDMGDFEELTADERMAITNCRGLRRAPIIIEDMRPLDSTSSNLEYSYRPLTKISQFWAGPSHWKFKNKTKSSLSLAQRFSTQTTERSKTQQNRQRRKMMKLSSQHVSFGEIHDDLFQKLISNKNTQRKTNVRKWDARKLKLPTDLQIDRNIFDVYKYAPGIFVHETIDISTPEIPAQSEDFNQDHEEFFDNVANDDCASEDPERTTQPPESGEQMNQTIFEIATDFVGAPDKVIKIIVPFAKRAKVVDMKQLKKCCMHVIKNQFVETEKENIEKLPELKNDKYKHGVATFSQTYKSLPNMLTHNMAEALSPSVALYSILHLANESSLRLISTEDLSDFRIYQLDQ